MTQSQWRNIPYEQKDVLLALPVKIGVWISHYDDQGDVKADNTEMEALTEIITYLADDKTSTAFVTNLFQDTLKAKEEWQSWSFNEDIVMDECRKGMQIIKNNVSDKDLKASREALLTVAEIVAQAYGEFGSYDESADEGGWLDSVKNALQKLKGHSYIDSDRPFNISPAEQQAINELRSQLQT